MAGYGAVDDRTPLLGTPSGASSETLVAASPFRPSSPSPKCDTRSWLAHDISPQHSSIFLLTVTLSTAVLDCVTYNRFATFASNQTGNTVFLALAAVHAGQRKLLLTATSFAGFVASGLLFGQLGAYFGHKRRAWILTSLVFQILVLAFFTALVCSDNAVFGKNARLEWLLIFLAAVQSGPQVTMSTNIDSLLPSAMLTSPIAGLLSDPDLFALRRAPNRDKRLVYVVTFIAGAHIGLGSDMVFNQTVTAVLALSLKIAALPMAIRIPSA